jgi:hypothetical protein
MQVIEFKDSKYFTARGNTYASWLALDEVKRRNTPNQIWEFKGESCYLIIGNKTIIIDIADFDKVQGKRTNILTAGVGYVRISGGTNREYLHRLIASPPPNMTVDHINNNPLDNRRCNLRIATQHENNCNRVPLETGTSKYRGVSWNKQKRKWQALIMFNRKSFFLGYHKTELEALDAYEARAKELFGEFYTPQK